jgi:Ca-activated chloride channel family protein
LSRRTFGSTAAATASLVLFGATASPLPVHIIRPGWLLALLPAALLWWALRKRGDAARSWRSIIAPELLAHLLSGADRRARFGPVAWLGLAWLLTIIAIASPTWKHEPAPFADDTAALAIVVRLSPSMETEDIQPSRIERAMQKVHDLLQARGNAKASLIAYAGSAHLVMPATSDTGIIDTFAQSLDPDIMPVTGDAAAAALELADRSLADAGGGSILWIADGVTPEQATALAQWRKGSSTTVRLWPPLAPGDELDALVATARPLRASLVRLAADDSDVQAVASAAKFADTYGDATDSRWAELGYWLTPLIALIVLPFFRRGWLVPLGQAG